MSSADELRELLRSTNYRSYNSDTKTPINQGRVTGRSFGGANIVDAGMGDSSKEELAALLSTLDSTLKTPLSNSFKAPASATGVSTTTTRSGLFNISNKDRQISNSIDASSTSYAKPVDRELGGVSDAELRYSLEEERDDNEDEGLIFSATSLPPPPQVPAVIAKTRVSLSATSQSTSTQPINASNSVPNVFASTGTSGTSQDPHFRRIDTVDNACTTVDEYDATVLHYHTDISLRSNTGKYLTASATSDIAGRDANSGTSGVAPGVWSGVTSATPTSAAVVDSFLRADGQGVGDPLDAFCIIPTSVVTSSQHLDQQDLQHGNTAGHKPIRYGSVVSIKAPAARERYLGLRDGKGIGFWRPLVGTTEYWTVLKGRSRSGSAGRFAYNGSISNTARGHFEEPNSRGTFVRQGDEILLFAGGADIVLPATSDASIAANPYLAVTPPQQMLCIYEGIDGSDVRLVHVDRHSGLQNEHFQIVAFGSQPLPAWSQRPYLTQRHLLHRPRIQKEITQRLFPNSPVPADEVTVDPAVGSPMLRTLSPHLQQSLLVRELLVALAGVEGKCLRILRMQDSPEDLNGNAANRSLSSSLPTEKLRFVKFVLDSTVCAGADQAVLSQVSQILPLCEQGVMIREFMALQSKPSYGLVSHAFSAGIRQVFREYDVLVAQLEHQYRTGALSLQRLVFLVQPSAKILRLFTVLITKLWDRRGGNLLDGLHQLYLEQGDSKCKDLVLHLLQAASQPFLHMVSDWIFSGELKDAYKEFMIQEDATVVRDAHYGLDGLSSSYWEHRLSLANAHVPKFLQSVAARILTAGKYLNVVRSCAGVAASAYAKQDGSSTFIAIGSADQTDTHLPQAQALELDADGSATSVIRIVNTAYLYSSRCLLRLLETGLHLSSHLRSLSRFFLLDHGDFFIQFMDTAEEELRREVKEINISRIQTLLQAAVTSSTLANDPNKDLLTCSIASSNLVQHLYQIQTAGTASTSSTQQAYGLTPARDGAGRIADVNGMSQGLKGVEALTLDYAVRWPLSLVLSKRSMAKYQLLSRLLFFSKHVELRLLSCWIDHQSTRELGIASGAQSSFLLRQRMIHFVQNFVYYMGLEVIAPRAHELHEGLQSAVDMDEVLGLHERFLDTCLKECLLSSQEQLRNLTKIMTTCLLFAEHMAHFCDSSFVLLKSAAKLTNAPALSQKEARSGTTTAVGAPRVGTGKSTSVRVGAQTMTIVEHRDVGAARRSRLATQSKYITREMTHPSFQRILNKFGETFDGQIAVFLESLWTDGARVHPQLANLCSRLDYNGFYSSKSAVSGGTGQWQ